MVDEFGNEREPTQADADRLNRAVDFLKQHPGQAPMLVPSQ
jgi:hypothetical protein